MALQSCVVVRVASVSIGVAVVAPDHLWGCDETEWKRQTMWLEKQECPLYPLVWMMHLFDVWWQGF